MSVSMMKAPSWQMVMDSECQGARTYFDAARNRGVILGDFSDATWVYKGVRLIFTRIGTRSVKSSNGERIEGLAGDLCRCFVIRTIRTDASPQQVVNRLAALRFLARCVGNNDDAWVSLSSATLNRAIDEIAAVSSQASTYQRANSIAAFVSYLNGLVARIDGVEVRFCSQFIRWKHGVRNPIRSMLEITSKTRIDRKDEKYEPNLHIALAVARAKVVQDPSLEPTPGYDLLRLEPLSFALSLGLRVGEICSLPINALDRDSDSERYFVRVPTEKQALAGATAVPEIWVEALRQAYAYLIEQCAEPRKRAREIEELGMEFIRHAIFDYRKKCPLGSGQLAQLKVDGISEHDYCFISELVSIFDFSMGDFQSHRMFSSSTYRLPNLSASRLVEWMDQRLAYWDWSDFAISRRRGDGSGGLSLLDVVRHAGVPRSSVIKSRWYVEDLRRFLKDLKGGGVFDSDSGISFESRDDWRRRWLVCRRKALSWRGGSLCTAVSIDKLQEILGQRYAALLSRHFKETFAPNGNGSGSGFVGSSVRAGVETKLSEHLIVLWDTQFDVSSKRRILPRPILREDFYSYLSEASQKTTVFARLSVLDDEGKPYTFSPHAIRRWVTTALLRSGPSETAIDLWMGRTPRQTRHYDYRTAKERAEFVRGRYLGEGFLPNDVLGRKVELWRDSGLSNSEIEEIICEKLKVIHYTPWGGCSRELYLSPCGKGLMCVRGFGTGSACSSFQIDPFDLSAKKNIEELRDKYLQMLRVVEPRYSEISDILRSELDSAEPLDQHIALMIDVVRGCDAALLAYRTAENH